MRHGPHHAAQKSTRTGSDESTALSKEAASASTIQGRAVWQKPQRGTPCPPGGTRLRLPQFVQAIVAALVMGVVAGPCTEPGISSGRRAACDFKATLESSVRRLT